MPKVDDTLLVKKFTKKPYRPWNLLDEPVELSTPIVSKPDQQKKRILQHDELINENFGQLDDKHRQNIGQAKDKFGENIGQSWDSNPDSPSYLSLVGLQKKITFLIYEACKASRNKITDPISIEYISTACKTTKLSAHKTIQRLENKKIIYRSHFKVGRGGWTQYGLYESIFQEILHEETQDKLRTNVGQIQDKLRTVPSSNKITITNEYEKNLNLGWQSVDLEPLKEIGFTKTHLQQIVQQEKLTIEMVQDSIYAFAFDLEYNNKQSSLKGTPLNYFMGIVRNGKPYAPPANYESPTDKAMRIYLESKKEQANNRDKLFKELFETSFQEWLSGLTDKLKNQIIPSEFKELKSEQPKRAVLRRYFETELWPAKLIEIKGGNTVKE